MTQCLSTSLPTSQADVLVLNTPVQLTVQPPLVPPMLTTQPPGLATITLLPDERPGTFFQRLIAFVEDN